MEEKKQRWIEFLGGKNFIFTCSAFLLLGSCVWLLSKIAFIFTPLAIILFAILPPAIFAIVLYYMFNPLVNWCQNYLPRIWAVSLLFLFVIGLFVLGGVLIFPSVQEQLHQLIEEFPTIFSDVQQLVQSFFAKTPFADAIHQSQSSLNEVWSKIGSFLENYLQNGAKGVGSVFSALSTTVITLVTGPIIAFFLLKDNDRFYQSSKKILPPVMRRDAEEIAQIVNQQIGDYLKGQVVSSIILGIMYWPFFLLIGLPFSGILAIAAGILCIIPYIGPFVVFIPGLIIALQVSWMMAVKFLIVWFVIQAIHGHLVVPRVMGDKLQMHPVTIIFVLLVMAELFGLIGVIFGIPIYCFVKVLVIYFFRRFKRRYNRFYGEKGRYEDTDFSKSDYLQ
ncbi:AI-2E family transporter [Enterococcus camelliae]|uniref:AI-2E family transporter n=1 Tax=Enterococcus camelliae TaxID=453959 RepID=A0ABW5TKI5_9ENTE